MANNAPDFDFLPKTSAEAANILRDAHAATQPISLIGAGTKAGMGNFAQHSAHILSTRGMQDLIAYQPEDLTITVGAGMAFDDLQNILRERGQWLPLDPSQRDGQTLGGVLATNLSGPKRLLYGTVRDLLIGCEFVLADGNIGRSGGRVVKNVAGFDLHKLMIGSFGTLGMLTEVTFKVLPLPQYEEWACAAFPSADAALLAARRAAASNISPAALEVVNAAARHIVAEQNGLPIADAPYSLFYAAEGVAVAVRDQMAALADICRAAGASDILHFAQSVSPYPTLRDLPFVVGGLSRPDNLVLKWNVTLAHIPQALAAAERIGRELSGDNAAIQVRAGTGIVYLGLQLRNEQTATAAGLIAAARAKMKKLEHFVVVEAAPDSLRAQVDAFGNIGDAFESMQAMKRALDPKGILNAGRFIEGL